VLHCATVYVSSGYPEHNIQSNKGCLLTSYLIVRWQTTEEEFRVQQRSKDQEEDDRKEKGWKQQGTQSSEIT